SFFPVEPNVAGTLDWKSLQQKQYAAFWVFEYISHSLKLFQIRLFSFQGTVWTQNILSLIYHEGHRDGTENMETIDRVPWLEYNIHNMDYVHRLSPRLFATNLPYYLVPRDLRNRRAKVIYVARNPKDVVVSYFHFSKLSVKLETIPDFNIFLERFLAGKVLAGSWLDHVTGWSTHRDDFNILFLTFEEMKKDLRGTVLKICRFLGKQLSEKELDTVVEKATFDKMKTDPRANYDFMLGSLLERGKGHFLRKGKAETAKSNKYLILQILAQDVLKEEPPSGGTGVPEHRLAGVANPSHGGASAAQGGSSPAKTAAPLAGSSHTPCPGCGLAHPLPPRGLRQAAAVAYGQWPPCAPRLPHSPCSGSAAPRHVSYWGTGP
uniref:Sulfotransferase n=1 Tax=Chrysemys picta bellii TaxID=8478 RepID=A0A8C3F7R5_CHRPI